MYTLLLLILAIPPQVEEPKEWLIKRTEKDHYIAAVRELDRATEMIDSEPREAVAKVTAVLGNSKIKYFECRLKVEMRSAEYERYTFFPHQVRGKAYISMAKRTSDPRAAKPTWEFAIADLQKSVDAKVPGSGDLLTEAKGGLEKCAKAIAELDKPDDPAVEFRRKHFDPAVSEGKYKTAAAYVDGAEGQGLPDDKKEQFRKEAESECAGYVEKQLNKLRQNLGDASAKGLRDQSNSSFNRQYADVIPAETELTAGVAKDPALGWLRRHIKTLKSIQASQGKAEDAFAAATEALPLDAADAEGENFWFRTMALLGWDLVEEIISERALKSGSSRKEVRTRLKDESDKAHALWKEFIEKTDKKALDRHPELALRSERLDTAARGFAVELPELASYDIDSCFLKDPGAELSKVEKGLLELESNLKGRVAIESRQELYTKIVNVGALRRFIEGKVESDVILDLRKHHDKLKEAGGPINPGQYGPRVKKVFEGL